MHETGPSLGVPASDDCVVIGSGPGGSLTAAHLAAAGRSVTVLEDGAHLGLDSARAFSRDEMEQKYRNGGLTVAFGPSRVQYVEARCAGGGSEINSGLYHRAPPAVLEHWRSEFGVEHLEESDLLPHYEANERRLSVSYLPSEQAAPRSAQLMRLGATKMGWESREVPRWFRYDASDDGGRRQSMTETFIPDMLQQGARLVTETRVTGVTRRGTQWVVCGRRNGRYSEPFEIAARNVFVCAGAVQTPAILRRSGIDRNVGKTLRLHPTVQLVAEFPEDVTDENSGVPSEQVKQFAPEISFGCSISSREYVALKLYGFREALRDLPNRWRRMAAYYAMAQGSGTGEVRVLRPFADPLVTYRLAPSDAGHLRRGLRLLCELLLAAGAVALYPVVAGAPILRSAADVAGVDEWFEASGANLMTIHLFSSVPMGEARERCAVVSFGRVYGCDGLYVADASLLPTSTTVNPQGTIRAIARRNVLEFLR